MSYYISPDNTLHFLSDDDVANGGERLLPFGSNAISDSEADAFIAAQSKPTDQQLEQRFTASIQKRLDDFAQQRNYDGILSACTYATSTVAKFKSEGQFCVNLRDATWAAAYDILVNVRTGQRPMPNDIADIEADLPELEWPQ